MNRTHETLVITMEECGEVIQECSKMIRFGHLDSSEQLTNKKERLSKEVGDLMLMIDLLIEQQLIDPTIVCNQKIEKEARLRTYSNIYNETE